MLEMPGKRIPKGAGLGEGGKSRCEVRIHSFGEHAGR